MVQHTVRFDVEDSTDLAIQFPGMTLPPTFRRAVRKRQVEYMAGRHCARDALRTCTPEHANAVVATGPRGEPVWPAGTTGSITHGGGLASAAVMRTNHARSLGIDIEGIMTVERAERVASSVAASDELGLLQASTGWPRRVVLTTVFSAKEVLFKCLYADVGRYFDFLDARVDRIDTSNGTFAAHLVTDLTRSWSRGYPLRGCFALEEHTLRAAMIIEA